MRKSSVFLDHVREVIRTNHLSDSTEKTYVSWIYKYIIFHNKRHPEVVDGKEIEVFLTYLTVERKVSASTQNQALHALVFLYKKVLKIPLDSFDFKPARIGKRLPVVLSRDEIIIRGGKGDNHQRTILPGLLIPQLKRQIEKVSKCSQRASLAIYLSLPKTDHRSTIRKAETALSS